MSSRPGGSEGPEDVDARFAEIIADLEREGLGAGLTEGADLPDAFVDEPTATPEPEQKIEPVTGPIAAPQEDPAANPAWRSADVEWDWASASEEEHYVPPEPPPLPRLRPGTIFGIVLMVIGILLFAAPGIIGLDSRIATPLGLVALAGGIGWLVLRMRQGPPPDSGWDDGAQI
ncbi:MAG TPA: hypothetical protein VHW44_02895 [Pseudonocardiaceae bacterium]|jgi:hypothetical protein|nr:hypothetical protein [Pseudonocardiaceae bacterium]